MEPGFRVTDFGRFRSGRVGSPASVSDPVLSFNMLVYRGVVSAVQSNSISAN